MPPAGGIKRKRSDRGASNDDVRRSSPHRPSDLDLANREQRPSSPSHLRDTGSNGRRNGLTTYTEETEGVAVRESVDTSAPGSMPSSSRPAGSGAANGPPPSSKSHEPSTLFSDQAPWIYVTQEIIDHWPDTGKEQIKSTAVDLRSHSDEMGLYTLVQELLHSGLDGKLSRNNVGQCIRDLISATRESLEDEDSNPIQDALLNTISVAFPDVKTEIPNVTELSEILEATEIDQDVFRADFDHHLLVQLGLVRQNFDRVFTRKQTSTLYRQANFNLLREESEGFSKLITEIFTTSGNQLPTDDVVQATVDKVRAMIGAFNLDVGRSLDVVLDVFGSVLVKQYRFFVKFLRASSWWPQQTTDSPHPISGLPSWAYPSSEDSPDPEGQHADRLHAIEDRDFNFWPEAERDGLSAFFRLGHVALPHDEREQAVQSTDNEYEQQWIRETGTIPARTNVDAAQLLGFKLSYYHPGSGGGPHDTTSRNLIYLAALLIKIGFISLHDLYPHLWRDDPDMDKLKEQKTKEKADRERAARPGAGARNALLMAGALADDTVSAVPSRLRETNTRASTPAKEAEPEPTPAKDPDADAPDQKVLLLQSLLAIGALPEALFIIGRFPWLIDLVPELTEYINRILHHTLSHVYEELRPLQFRGSLQDQRPSHDQVIHSMSVHGYRPEETPVRKTLRWPLLDKDDSEVDGINYRFYWDEWNDAIPVCRTIDDIFVLSRTLLPLIGARIGQDPTLVLKLARIGKHSLREDPSIENKNRWLDLSKRLFLPSLSLLKPNPGVVNEVFEMLSMFSTDTRYLMYLEWLNGSISRRSDMKAAFDQARAETRDILKRISKTNIRPMARALAKVAYANPHIVITTALNQIESYDSIADVFVEGARYFTDLGYDVLTWALVSSMNKAGRRRVQEDGIFTSKWLTALANFAGKIYKRYELMKAGPVLQYVSVQIEKGLSTDLIMLEQIISAMGGIAPDNDFNDSQMQAMGGGPILQAQTLLQLLDTRHNSQKSSKRLIRALLDYGLAAKLLLALAQLRQNCVFAEGEVPLKAIAHIFDEVTRVLGQYLDLLRANMTIEEFANVIPGVVSMISDYDVPSEIAFWFCRPILAQQMADFDKESVDSIKDVANKDINGDVEMPDEESEEDGEAEDTDEVETTLPTPGDDDAVVAANSTAQDEAQVPQAEQWHPVLRSVMDDLQAHVSDEILSSVGVGFYVTFWQLSVYDIFVPSSYSDEIQRQKRQIASKTADRSNITPQAVRNKETSIKKMQQLIEDLMAENKQHVNAKKLSTLRLTQESRQWFAGKARQLTELNVALMEHCFLPRILASPLDAYFCYKFLKFMHSSGTPNFHTVGFYDQFFKAERLASLIFTCTSKESDNLGRFVNEVLKDLAKWHGKKSAFEAGAHGNPRNQEKLPGFASKLHNGKALKTLEYDEFRKLLYKWHSFLSSALCKCLASSEYMHVRNAISILRVITQAWPAVKHHSETIKSAVELLGKSDREDIKVSSQALLGSLTRRAKQLVSSKAFMGDSDAAADDAKSESQSQEKQQAQSSALQDTSVAPEKEIRASTPGPTANGDNKSKDLSKPADRVATVAQEKPAARSSSQGPKPAALPARPTPDSSASERRPRPIDSKPSDLPRRLSPPPRHSSSNLPPRPGDSRTDSRDLRSSRPSAGDPLRPDSRSGYSRNDVPPRGHDPAYDRPPRYPPSSERPAPQERDDRSHRREHEPRAGYEERRPLDRDGRPVRDHRYEREPPRPSERDLYARPGERDYGRPYPESGERRRHEPPTERRPEPAAPARPPNAEAAPSINPQRAAMINTAEDTRPGMSIRGQAQDRPSRSSRNPSPRRDEERKPLRPERDERSDRRTDGPSRSTNPTAPSPAGPRGGPPLNQSREVRGQGRPAVDMSHGRLEQDPSSRPPPRNERTLDAEPPSGPRTRPSSNTLRNNGPPPSPGGGRSPPSERMPPSGPGRHARNTSVPEPPVPAISTPTNDTSGIHPDRLNHISPTSAEPPRNQRGPPLQTSIPSGPRGNGPPTGPSMPSPSSRAPPSGPQSEAPRGRGRDVMNTVNSTLAQAARGPAAPPTRGRGGRQNSASFPHSPMGPPSSGPGMTSSRDYNAPPQDPNPNGMPVQPRGPSRPEGMDDNRRTRGARPEDAQRNDRDESGRPPRREDGPPPARRDTRGGYGQGPPPPGPADTGRPPRKHPRDDGGQQPYGASLGRGGARVASDAKRPRRGG